jgi:hypothetical protein
LKVLSINDAGQCVVEMMVEDRPVAIVLLNSFGSLTRTADARRVRKWMEGQGQAPGAKPGAFFPHFQFGASMSSAEEGIPFRAANRTRRRR